MVRLTHSLQYWLSNNYPNILPFIILGRVDLFTNELQNEYIEWCQTDEGREYLKGGRKYVPTIGLDEYYEREII